MGAYIMSTAYNDIRIEHSEAIERTVDEIIEVVLQDSHVEHTGDEGPPVTAETWLACKAEVLALLETVLEQEGTS
jgi:hypothetical protein